MSNNGKPIYRVGDTIQIVNPRIVLRVGYPLVWTELVEEYRAHPKLGEAMALLGLLPDTDALNRHSRLTYDFIVGCAKAGVRQRGFGGKERRIYYSDQPFMLGQTCEVWGKRVAKTGDYYPPYSGYSYEGEYDYEPGGLSNDKTHILLSTAFGEVDSDDVRLVKSGS